MRTGALHLFRSAAGAITLALGLALTACPPALAQAGDLALELDLERLLFESSARFQDSVWRLNADDGRSIVLVPLVVNPVTEKAGFGRSPVEMRAGTFVGFYIPEQEPSRTEASRVRYAQLASTTADAFTRLVTEQADPDNQDTNTQTPELPEPAQTDDDASASPKTPTREMPENLPRMAREITLQPDGTIIWALERTFRGAQLQGGSDQNLYPYKIDAQLLREKEPPRAERITRNEGEDSRAYSLRKREEQNKQREVINAYRELRDKVRDLPTTFVEPAPPVIYAVFQARKSEDVTLQGQPPLPWRLAGPDRAALTKIGSGALRNTSDETEQAIKAVARLAKSPHALDARAAALALHTGKAIEALEKDSPAYGVFTTLLEGRDPIARRVALYAVAKNQPPSYASASLMKVAASASLDNDRQALQFAWLKRALELDAANPENIPALVSSINEALADAKGPNPTGVIERVLDAVDQDVVKLTGEDLSAVVGTMVNQIDLSKLSKKQADTIINETIRRAPTNPVAAGWLDVKLLRSADADQADRALELLSQSPTDAQAPEPETNTELGPAQAPVKKTIPLYSDEHGLLKALDSTDAKRRERAWKGLAHFHIAQSPDESKPQGTAEETAEEHPTLARFNAILRKGIDQDHTPPALLDFILNQSDPAVASAVEPSVLSLLTDPGIAPQVAERAAKEVVDAKGRYGTAIRALRPGAQASLVIAMYRSLTQESPLVVGLIANPETNQMNWFLQTLGEGKLPSARELTEQLLVTRGQGDQQMIKAACSEEPEIAVAAAAALVLNAGGDRADQQKFGEQLLKLEKREEAIVAEVWSKEKIRIHTKVLLQARGVYRVVATLHPADQPLDAKPVDPTAPAEAADPKAESPKRFELGLVELLSQGPKVFFSVEAVKVSLSPDQMAIRIESPASLGSLSDADLSDLPLSQAREPIDMRPRDDGSWSGTAELTDGRRLKVAIEPSE